MNMLRHFLIAVLSLTASTMFAAVAIVDDGTSPIVTATSPDTSLGYTFTTGPSALLVTSLGLWDDNNDGFANWHEVFLFQGMTALAGVTIEAGSGSALLNEFRYVDLAQPLLLEGDRTYTLWATNYGNSTDGYRTSNSPGPAFSPDIASASSVFQHDPGLGYPLAIVGGSPIVGPNFQYSAIPEPSSALLLILATGIAYLSFRQCRRDQPR